jgi:hypothetical protein
LVGIQFPDMGRTERIQRVLNHEQGSLLTVRCLGPLERLHHWPESRQEVVPESLEGVAAILDSKEAQRLSDEL